MAVWVFGCLGICLLAGCGAGFESTVSGKVTLGGEPLTKGNVGFHPVGGGPVANGTIQEDGTYRVKTGTGRGLPPGEYKVIVVATDPPPPDDDESAGTLLTPAEYGNTETTPLTYTIKAGANHINLEIPAPPPE